MRENDTTARRKGGMPLHWKMAIGFFAGLALGLFVHATSGADAAWVQGLTHWVTQPVGTLFLRLIFMLVLPLLFSALVVGVAEMGDIRSLGRIGWKTLAYTVVVSGIAVVLGLVLVNWLKPGAGVDPATAQTLLSEGAQRAKAIVSGAGTQPQGLDMLLSIVPDNIVGAAASNGILAVMFFALMLGIGLVLTPAPSARVLLRGIEGLFEVSMTLIGLVIRLAPYAAKSPLLRASWPAW
jgi:DAACS family dicarboxylate/amino acid:cation (Na+ or H+) symporter